MSVLSALIMFNTKKFKSSTLKITFGLFLSVLIYYINNFLYVLGNTEKISFLMSIWIPLVILMSVNIGMSVKINEK